MNWGDPRLPPRFWDKVQPEPNSGCWLWLGTTSTGYGRFLMGSRTDKSRKLHLAHRVSYTALHGSVPDGLDLDHLCRVRLCCNPLHLEAVTHRENVLRSPIARAAIHSRKTHCPHGHPYDSENTVWYRGKWRYCGICSRAGKAKRQLLRETRKAA